MAGKPKRSLIQIYGLVQGVGYRPYIYKMAEQLNIKGFVNNCDSSVFIDAEGNEEDIKKFWEEIIKSPPKLARIHKFNIEEVSLKGYKNFRIEKSNVTTSKLKFVVPDVATCDKCVEDIFNKNSKKYKYAFTNCTDCGPRYSIIKSIPYDRESTTMKEFKMCPSCSKEYTNPQTRRFHAQPNCCIECGPKLMLINNDNEIVKCKDEIKECAKLIKEGKIIAVKGIGGFHIVCDAFNKGAIKKIRDRKKRPDKPLAIMVKDIKKAKEICFLNEKEEEVLTANRRPIVLLNKKEVNLVPNNIAPKLKKLGVMLPYTPVHYLLFHEGLQILVMTSGNISGKPIEYKNAQAVKNLKGVVDYFLLNNRDINTPIDDSVVKVVNGIEILCRPGRGYAPIFLDRNIDKNIFACGSEMKSTFGFSKDGIVYSSQYLGDLKELDSYKEYKKAIKNLTKIFKFTAEAIGCDIHPYYMSTLYAKSQKGMNIKVQHHHAHMASCMLEHDLYDDAIGVIYDGTGLGLDNNIWGGEFLVGNREKFTREGSYKYVNIQGGDSAQKNIWKIAVSYIYAIEDKKIKLKGLKRMEDLIGDKVGNICKAIDYNINCFKTSSLGRLFDGVSAILGLIEKVSYEGQGAIELEAIIDEKVNGYYDYFINKGDIFLVDYLGVFKGILRDIENGVPPCKISSKFHNTIVNITLDMVEMLREKFMINKVILSGGVFENEYLLKNIVKRLKEKGFYVFFNKIIPTNDSGICFGQIAVCHEILKKR